MRPDRPDPSRETKWDAARSLIENSGASEAASDAEREAFEAERVRARSSLFNLCVQSAGNPAWVCDLLSQFAAAMQELHRPCDCCKCQSKGGGVDRQDIWLALAATLLGELEGALQTHYRPRGTAWLTRRMLRWQGIAGKAASLALSRASDAAELRQRPEAFLVLLYLLTLTLLLVLTTTRRSWRRGSSPRGRDGAAHQRALALIAKDEG